MRIFYHQNSNFFREHMKDSTSERTHNGNCQLRFYRFRLEHGGCTETRRKDMQKMSNEICIA
jgi:hypothetical protein